MIKEKPKSYCNNKELLSWIVKLKDPNISKKEKYLIDNNIGLAIDSIANRFSLSHQYVNYTYREDMIGDAIVACVRALPNFDPEKSNNPFAYFTQICHNAFIARITFEKKHQYIKQKVIRNFVDYNVVFNNEEDHDTELQESTLQMMEEYNNGNDDGLDYFRKKENKNKKDKEIADPFEGVF